MLRQFVVLLLCPPAPFTNSLADPVSFADALLQDSKPDSRLTSQRQILASVLAASKSEIALKMFELGLLLQDLKDPLPEDISTRTAELEHALAFWISVS